MSEHLSQRSPALEMSPEEFREAGHQLVDGIAAFLESIRLAQYHRLQATPECVVLPAGQKILSSPLDSATPLLAVPAGAIVRKLDERGNWYEIRYDTTRGWLPAGVLARVP